MPRNRAPAIALMLGHVRLPPRFDRRQVEVMATVWLSTINGHNRREREALAAETTQTVLVPQDLPAPEPLSTPDIVPLPRNALAVHEQGKIADFIMS